MKKAVLLLILALALVPLSGATIDWYPETRGWWLSGFDDDGNPISYSNEAYDANYYAGFYETGDGGYESYRNFFLFADINYTGTLTGAQLAVFETNGNLPPNDLVYRVYAVTGPLNFDSIGTGTLLGEITIPPGTNGLLYIDLNSDALALLTPGTTLYIGGRTISGLRTGPGGDFYDFGPFGGSGGPDNPTFLRLFTDETGPGSAVPEPSSIALVAGGIGVLIALRRRR